MYFNFVWEVGEGYCYEINLCKKESDFKERRFFAYFPEFPRISPPSPRESEILYKVCAKQSKYQYLFLVIGVSPENPRTPTLRRSYYVIRRSPKNGIVYKHMKICLYSCCNVYFLPLVFLAFLDFFDLLRFGVFTRRRVFPP